MIISNYQVRRATVDDLAALRQLWLQAQRNAPELEKRLTDFQVVETPNGELLGAIGLQLAAPHGKMHSEAYKTPTLAEDLRPRLWERVQTVARNHGLSRLWVESGSSMFWLEVGFEVAQAEMVHGLPESFSPGREQPWLTLKIREDAGSSQLMEQELAVFRESQRVHRESVVRQTRLLRWVAGLVVFIVLLLMVWASAGIWQHWRRGHGP